MQSINYIALSQQTALRRQMDVIANNIANASTPGYKAQHTLFSEYLAKTQNGTPISYVQEKGIGTDFAQGPMQQTGADFDFAINGEGFFTVGSAIGNRYTRAGHFVLDENGQIITSRGDPLLSDGGAPIVVPSAAKDISVTKTGTILADGAPIGKIGLVKFDQPNMLVPDETGMLALPEGLALTPQTVDQPDISQGFLEQSNVQSVVEMTSMMQVARSYESTQKIIEREDDRVRQLIRRLGQNQ